MHGRVKMCNPGVCPLHTRIDRASVDPLAGNHGAMWLIGWRFVQAFRRRDADGGLAAILTDAVPAKKRGMALEVNQIAGSRGSSSASCWRAAAAAGLAPGVLGELPMGVFGTVSAYKSLREVCDHHHAGQGRAGSGTSCARWASAYCLSPSPTASGATAGTRVGVDQIRGSSAGYRQQHRHAGGLLRLRDEDRPSRCFRWVSCVPRIRAFAAGEHWPACSARSPAADCSCVLVIWLRHSSCCRYTATTSRSPRCGPGFFMLPLTAGFLIAGPISRRTVRPVRPAPVRHRRAAARHAVLRRAHAATMASPARCSPLLIFGNGVGSGLFASPNACRRS